MRDPRIRPLTSATVTVNGSVFGPRQIIWAGFFWDDAYLAKGMTVPHLCVPWCHPNDHIKTRDLAVYRVRPRDERFRIVLARNGLWILREKPRHETSAQNRPAPLRPDQRGRPRPALA